VWIGKPRIAVKGVRDVLQRDSRGVFGHVAQSDILKKVAAPEVF
jgi:hypothetical protein